MTNIVGASIKSLCKLFILLVLCASARTSGNMADSTAALHEEFASKSADFGINMFHELSLLNGKDNIIFSPFSIQTCVAMARMGAEGETAAEIDRGLGLVSNDVNTIADTFYNVLSAYERNNILKIANKIYVMQGFSVKKTFNEILEKKFFSTAEEINFEENVESARNINTWVESKTNNLIKDLITPSALGPDTRLVLLNAIHFKGEWLHKFPEYATRDDDFFTSETQSVQVPMMNLKERFRYAELPDLDAVALEMPYRDSDLSMLVILPNSRTGLKALTDKLREIPLADISKRLRAVSVIVKFPKFKAEFEVELSSSMRKLGMKRLFSSSAEFGNMLESTEGLQVSKVIHKAFIDVNEEGTEAAAATGIIQRKKRSIVIEEVKFTADRPFVYVIAHKSVVAADDGSVGASTSIPLFFGTVVALNGVVATNIEQHDEL